MKKVFFIFYLVLLGLIGIFFIEKISKQQLIQRGILNPQEQKLGHLYGRRLALSGLYEENTPSFSYGAFDSTFKNSQLTTDQYGFVSDVPIQQEKDSQTIRIFLMGGSAAFGSIQNQDQCGDTSYPRGTYDYATSIAGQIKKRLKQKYPQKKIEVINAAVVCRKIHQGYTEYLQKIHDFHPDLIINFDGYNDGASLLGVIKNDPYRENADQIEEALELEILSRIPSRPYSLFLLNYLSIKKDIYSGKDITCNEEFLKNIPDSIIPFTVNQGILDTFQNLLRNTDQKIHWILDNYQAQLEKDGVKSIFCLQPTLEREYGQKELSTLEKKMYAAMYPPVTLKEKLCLESNMPALIHQFPEFKRVVNIFGNERLCHINRLSNGFGPQLIAPILDSIVGKHHGVFIDIGQHIQHLTRNQEFYVDYCHLTPFGNAYIAEIIAPEIEKILSLK